LKGEIDTYNGVLIDPAALPHDLKSFEASLKASLLHWEAEGRRGIWLTLRPSSASFLPASLECGFRMHVCDPETNTLTLNKWLPKGKNKLPAPPSTFIGVGGFVINSKGQMLVVKEITGPAAKRGNWKIPGGICDEGEYIHQAAVREVLEETGVRTEFVCMAAFRQHPGARLGKTDIYFVCVLKPLDEDIRPQEDEIAEARWMEVSEFFDLSPYKGVWQKMMLIGAAAARGDHKTVFGAEELPVYFRPGTNFVYSAPFVPNQ